MINRYTVIGQPVAHSLSPVVHHLFGDLTQRKIAYTRTEINAEEFAQFVVDWQASGAKGCNVTAPFKELAIESCDKLGPTAARARSVNTIHMHRDGSRIGHNTDGLGLVADIVGNKRTPIQHRRVLMLGAGGAARGVMAPLLEQQPALLHIANRTEEKAQVLAEEFADLGAVSGSSYEALARMPAFDIVINATSLGLSGGMPPVHDGVLAQPCLAYDMTYAGQDTDFMRWCKERNANAVNGLGMLVEQAAESFFFWEGVRPKTRLVYPKLFEYIAAQSEEQ